MVHGSGETTRSEYKSVSLDREYRKNVPCVSRNRDLEEVTAAQIQN
jgi:hypothetical protein